MLLLNAQVAFKVAFKENVTLKANASTRNTFKKELKYAIQLQCCRLKLLNLRCVDVNVAG